MKTINFIGILYKNDSWDSICKDILVEVQDYINPIKCIEQKLYDYYESELHATIMYNETYKYGPNYALCRMITGDPHKWLIRSIRDKELEVPEVVIDTFDNEDSRVLKINLNSSNQFSNFDKLHNLCEDDCSELGKHGFNMHFTITYLDPNTPDEVIDKVRRVFENKYSHDLIKFKAESLLLSNKDESIRIKFDL